MATCNHDHRRYNSRRFRKNERGIEIVPERASCGSDHPAGRESLVEHFEIVGLYGYQNVSLPSQYAATILIAQNGAGRTTLLAALDVFLKVQFIRLRELPFERILCRLRGVNEELVDEARLVTLFELPEESDFFKQARKIGVEVDELLTFIERDAELAFDHYPDWHETKIVQSIMRTSDYSTRDAKEFCTKLKTIVLFGAS